MRYALVTNPDDFVVGTWSGPGPGVPPSRGNKTVNPVNLATWRQYNANATYPDSSQKRWKYTTGGGLVEQADPRPTVRAIIGAASTENGGVDAEFLVGDPQGTLTLQVLRPNGTVNTNVNRDDTRIQLAGFKLKVDVVAGEATIPIPTGKARDVEITSNDQMILENTVNVSVVATEV